MAANPSQLEKPSEPIRMVRIAPTTVMPEIAFEPDISGVCSCEGTLAISSKPRKAASTKMNKRSVIISMGKLYFCSLESKRNCGRVGLGFARSKAFVYYSSVVSDETAVENFVVVAELEFLGFGIPEMLD